MTGMTASLHLFSKPGRESFATFVSSERATRPGRFGHDQDQGEGRSAWFGMGHFQIRAVVGAWVRSTGKRLPDDSLTTP